MSDAPTTILGLSALYHDAAAALIVDGEVVAAAQQERFSRIKHDASFPLDAIRYCLREGGVPADGLTAVAYYDKPLTTFVRILKSYVAAGPRGIRTFPTAMSEWSTRKLWTSLEIERGIRSLGWAMPKDLYYAEHHISHAAAAFYPSPFERAAIVTMDGVGEWATSSIGVGRGRTVELLREQRFPDSLGLLYSAFTYHCGFRVNSGEYKLMGLAPYGTPRYVDRILEIVDLADDGSIRMDLRYFDYLAGRRMTNARFDALFDGPARDPEAPITDREVDLARSIQEVVERAVLGTARTAREITGETNLVLAGGVALNCVANGRLDREGPFEAIWIQPAAGDAGSALGCALWAHHDVLGNPRSVPSSDGMHGTYLGPAFSGDAIAAELDGAGRPFERITDPAARAERIAGLLADGNVVAVLQGRMEFGPRALGHRSILADARDPEVQRSLNLRVKNRESFRPFAPAVLAEHASEWFDLDHDAPYMTFVAPVAERRWVEPVEASGTTATITDVVAQVRSEIPAVTHVDHSARVQTVDAERSPRFHRILEAFHRRTGCPVLVNTSFNVRGEPIVATPDDAYRCFMTTDIDHLVLEDCILTKSEQPAWDGPAPTLELD